jgi:hypothetical protein
MASYFLANSNISKSMTVETGNTIVAGDVVSVSSGGKICKGFGIPTHFPAHGSADVPTDFVRSCQLTTTLYVVSYKNTLANNNTGYVVAVSVSGSTLTWGTPVQISSVSVNSFTEVKALSASSFIVAFSNSTTNGQCRVGSVSGTTITLDPTTGTFNAGNTASVINTCVMAVMSGTQVIFVYRDNGNSNKGAWTYLELGGSFGSHTFTFNTEVVFNNATTGAQQNGICAVPLDSTRVLVVYDNNQTGIFAIIGTLAGSGAGATITSGLVASYTTLALSARDMSVAKLTTDKCIFTFRQTLGSATSGYIMVLTTTDSGTAAASQLTTFQTAGVTKFNDSMTITFSDVKALSATAFIITYTNNAASSVSEIVMGTVSDNTITMGQLNNPYNIMGTYSTVHIVSATEAVAFYKDTNFQDRTIGIYFTYSGTTPSFPRTKGQIPIGIAQGAATAGTQVLVMFKGISTAHSGLRPGIVYYGHADGSLLVTNAATDGSYDIKNAGRALDSTSLLMTSFP